MEDYYTHHECNGYRFDPKSPAAKFCGLDLHNGTIPDWNQTGVYSARLFAAKAQEIAANHNKDKVCCKHDWPCVAKHVYIANVQSGQNQFPFSIVL